MKIKLSRHAKRRTKIYKIPESRITDILNRIDPLPGKHEIIEDIKDFKYPLRKGRKKRRFIMTTK